MNEWMKITADSRLSSISVFYRIINPRTEPGYLKSAVVLIESSLLVLITAGS